MQVALLATMVGSTAALTCYTGTDGGNGECDESIVKNYATQDCGVEPDWRCFTGIVNSNPCMFNRASCMNEETCVSRGAYIYEGLSCCDTDNCNLDQFYVEELSGVGKADMAAAAVAAVVIAYAL